MSARTGLRRVDDLIIINPHVEHTEKTLANNPMEYIVFGVEGLAFSFTEPDQRLAACKELLISSNLSVAQVASSAGFSSQSYFSQIFRKKTGMTPRQYRSRYSKKQAPE